MNGDPVRSQLPMVDSNYNSENETNQNQFEDLTLKDDTTSLAAILLRRCEDLIAEVSTFQKTLVEQKKYETVGIRHFKNNLNSECKSLQRLVEADPNVPRTAHALRSSNLPFYAAVWNAAKASTGVVALEKRFYWCPSPNPKKPDDRKQAMSSRKRYSVLVDIVSRDGLEWIKVSSITEKRIIFDLAKAGYYSSEDEMSEDDEPEGLMKQAEALLKASKATRVRYRHPNVRLVLPKVIRGRSKGVDQILKRIEALGIKVETTEDVQEALPIGEVLQTMSVDPFASFSDTVNIDCTILLALVSDLSHSSVAPEDWHHQAILRQIEVEKKSGLLPNSLWPAISSRSLVCTREAATRMREIVDQIGTSSERQRMDYLLELPGRDSRSKEQRVKAFQELSAYDVPLKWNLPIVVIEAELTIKAHLPSIANKVLESQSAINKSVFLYGWAAGMTTISSNRTVTKEIEALVETYRESEKDVGPDIWLCPTARSLVGKEKLKRNCPQ